MYITQLNIYDYMHLMVLKLHINFFFVSCTESLQVASSSLKTVQTAAADGYS